MADGRVRWPNQIASADRAADLARVRGVHAATGAAAAPASMVLRQRRVWRVEGRSRVYRRGILFRLDLGGRGRIAAGVRRVPGSRSYWARLARILPSLAGALRVRTPRPSLLPRGAGRDGGSGRARGDRRLRRDLRGRDAVVEAADRRVVGSPRARARTALPRGARRDGASRSVGTADRSGLDRLVPTAVVEGAASGVRLSARRDANGDAVVIDLCSYQHCWHGDPWRCCRCGATR